MQRFVVNWIAAEKTRAGLRHAVVYVQRKRAHAGLLAKVGNPQTVPTCKFVYCFCFVSFLSVFAFNKSVALRSVVLRYTCCTDIHT